jgi:hypothetical protein
MRLQSLKKSAGPQPIELFDGITIRLVSSARAPFRFVLGKESYSGVPGNLEKRSPGSLLKLRESLSPAIISRFEIP